MIRRRIKAKSFRERHRRDSSAFTRRRKLPFRSVLLLIVQKSLKSLQLVLNECFSKLSGRRDTVTHSAFSQARQKLLHTAFIELTQTAIIEPYYRDGDYRRFDQFRLVAVDGSKLILPDSADIIREFGAIRYTNGKDRTIIGHRATAVCSVVYDVLNRLPLDSRIAPFHANEIDLCIEQLPTLRAEDLLLFDRGYGGYRFWATLIKRNQPFVGRCNRAACQTIREMFHSDAPDSKIVTLRPRKETLPEMQSLDLPLEITVRLIRVVLKTGEVEVLITSLLDENRYPHSIFKDLYYRRWGIETFYGIIKDRLQLENFSGKTAESIKQDFYATIFISALESVMIEDAQERMDEEHHRERKQLPKQVNKAVSFNAIKNQVFELLYSSKKPDEVIDRLTQLFMTNPVYRRQDRTVKRTKTPDRRKYNHIKRVRKICF